MIAVKQHSPRFLAWVERAGKTVTFITAETLWHRLQFPRDFYLFDVREESEWALGHLPHAKHLSKGVIERDIEKIVSDTATEVILYCSGGFRSTLAANSLQQMGYQSVKSLVGGTRQWQHEGYGWVESKTEILK